MPIRTATSDPSVSDAPPTAHELKVYNTLVRDKEPFRPVHPGRVGIYLCGPTVYKEAHIGHMVGPVIFDTIKRYLTYCGYQVTWVVNITDVDDKLIAESQRRGIPMDAVAREMTEDYLRNLEALGVDTIDHMPRATEHIDEIQKFIQQLIDQNLAYVADGDVYFDVAEDREYGKLSNRTLEGLEGDGGEGAERKRSPADFALWKRAKPGEPSWDSPWGPGRPGWHIECSAMSRKLLGETFDIHGGGLDLIFPHHENEIAQSECCHGKPMARYWVHNGLLRAAPDAGKVGGRTDRQAEGQEAAEGKMSRSKGAGGLADLIRRHGGERIRFFLLRSHYRSTIVFSDEALEEAGAGLETFYRYFERFQRITGLDFYTLDAPTRRSDADATAGPDRNASSRADSADPHAGLVALANECRRRFLEKMDDDFNTGGAIGELFDLVRALNRFIDQRQLDGQRAASPEDRAALVAATRVLRELSQILGLFRSPRTPTQTGADADLVAGLVELLVETRAEARRKKDFQMADNIRNRLADLGIVLEDRKDGTSWRRSG